MSIWIALAVLACSILDDVGYVFFVRRVMRGSKWSAALLSAGLTLLVSFEGYMQYAVDPGYIIANSLGSAIGCPLAMWLEDRMPRKPKPRTKDGQFKQVPSIILNQHGRPY